MPPSCHIYLSDSELEGKATTTRIGALQVWQKQDGGWKLLARQGFRLPALGLASRSDRLLPRRRLAIAAAFRIASR